MAEDVNPVQQRNPRTHRRYREMRARFLGNHPLCVLCKKDGFIVSAVEVDHVLPISQRPDLVYEESNWQALCETCHKRKTAHDNAKDADVPGRAEWKQELMKFD